MIIFCSVTLEVRDRQETGLKLDAVLCSGITVAIFGHLGNIFTALTVIREQFFLKYKLITNFFLFFDTWLVWQCLRCCYWLIPIISYEILTKNVAWFIMGSIIRRTHLRYFFWFGGKMAYFLLVIVPFHQELLCLLLKDPTGNALLKLCPVMIFS